MYEAARLPDLWVLVRRQSGHLDRLRRLHLPTPGKAASIVQDHRRILRAIAATRDCVVGRTRVLSRADVSQQVMR